VSGDKTGKRAEVKEGKKEKGEGEWSRRGRCFIGLWGIDAPGEAKKSYFGNFDNDASTSSCGIVVS